MLFSPERIQEIHAAAVSLRVDRAALLAAVHASLVSELSVQADSSEQLLADLQRMNAVGSLADGTVPLHQWLEAAVPLSETRIEGRVFKAALYDLRRTLGRISALERSKRAPLLAIAKDRRWYEGERGVRCFVSFHPKDHSFLEKLEAHLAPLLRAGTVLLVHSDLASSIDQGPEADTELRGAGIILILLSPDYLADARSYAAAERAMRWRELSGVRVIPIVARACAVEGTLLSRLQLLPRDGRPLSSQRDPDAAYAEITTVVRIVATDIAAATPVHAAPPAPLPAPRGSEPSPRLRVGAPVREIFKTSGTPNATWVEPVQFRRLRALLEVRGRGLIVEGPSRIGKSTAVRVAMGPRAEWLRANSRRDLERLVELSHAERLDGYVVVEDAHLLPAEVSRRLSDLLHLAADDEQPTGKVVLVSVNRGGRSLVEAHTELAGRVDVVRFGRQPEDRIRDVVTRGEAACNVRFVHKAEIVAAAAGSFQLAQMLCCEALQRAEIDEVPREPRSVQVMPEDIADVLVTELDYGFKDALLDAIVADRETKSPGACLSLLWMLAFDGDDEVATKAARERFPRLKPAFDWIDEGGLERAFAARPRLAELLHARGGTLSAQDPRLVYYLQLRLRSLAAEVGLSARATGEGEIDIRPVDGRPRPRAATEWIDARAYRFHDANAARLRDLLVKAYSEVHVVRQIALDVPIDISSWESSHGIKPAWESLLKLSAAQGRLRALVGRVLKDGQVRGYHEEIGALLGLDLNPGEEL